MDFFSAVPTALIILGAVIMGVNIIRTISTWRMFSRVIAEESKSVSFFFRILIVLMFFFLIGYTIVGFAMVTQVKIISELFVGLIFLFGALFVYLGIMLQIKMIHFIKHHYNKVFETSQTLQEEKNNLKQANENLSVEVTERKKAQEKQRSLEKQLLHSQKMESIGTLAGGIAHDFNNILYPIVGYTELIMQNSDKEGTEYKRLTKILNATARAQDLVQQILILSRNDEQAFKPIYLQFIINEALGLLESTLPKNIQIENNITNDYGYIMGDETQIHQIIINLCTNAYHAMEKSGGILSISVEETTITPSPTKEPQELNPGSYLKMSVSDTGHGMAPETTARVFDPYFTTKPVGKGSGLGLSVTHGIVKKHGGNISVSSTPEKGTTVFVYLPVIENHSILPEINTPVSLPKGDERIFLIDDEEAIIMMQEEILSHLGYHVTTETDSKTALDKFHRNPFSFDLVITDMNMPEYRGDHIVRAVKKIRPDIPVILCTGFSDSLSNTQKTLEIDGIVLKPATQSKTATLVRQVLDAKVSPTDQP